MKKRIFWSIILTSFILVIVSTSLIIAYIYNDFSKDKKNELAAYADYIIKGYEFGNIDYLESAGKDSDSRITLVAPSGKVMYDNFAPAETLLSHSDRPEIIQAFKEGSGEATRNSDTLGAKTYYYAELLENGNVIRVSSTMKSILRVIDNTATVVVAILVFALVISIVIAQLLTRAIIKPINKIDIDNPLYSPSYDELSPFLLRMDEQNKKINQQIEQLSEKQKEFSNITDEMSEAMVIFGMNKKILSMNKSAKTLFNYYQNSSISYYELCRDCNFIETLESAFNGKSSVGTMMKSGKIYRISANPVNSTDNSAAVFMAVDVTEKETSERMRREFSANVSHELKTPLTTIMGYAEIMHNGVAKQEDFPQFSHKIYTEAQRLLVLIEDIIKLSRLDEKSFGDSFVDVDLYKVSQSVISELTEKAEKSNIQLYLEGENLIIKGIEQTIHEMIFNLCDNAINYNRPGGSVNISVFEQDGHSVISVRDTGIGIAPEHQSRVFERFYRVDKSHSKETGGTGLGLSIVKHGAILHNAQIKLESTLGKETKISLVF